MSSFYQKFREELISIAPSTNTKPAHLHFMQSSSSKCLKGDEMTLRVVQTVSVLVRGEITHRIFNTWKQKLSQNSRNWKINLVDVYIPSSESVIGTSIIVLPKICDWQTFCKYLEKSNPYKVVEIPDPRLKIVPPEFIVDLLLMNRWIDPEDPRYIHPLRSSKLSSSPSIEKCQEISIIASIDENVIPPLEECRKTKMLEESFLCARPVFSIKASSSSLNENIIKTLEEMRSIYEMQGDAWRAHGYKKAVAQLKRLPEINSVEQVAHIRGIGKRLRNKIGEIIETGNLKKLKYLNDDPKTQSLLEVGKIWGVGSKTAERLVKMGFTSIEKLRLEGRHLLTTQQRIGLQHYEDLQKKIPREEVERIYRLVSDACQQVLPEAECTVCGSYRRGRPESGDVDILILPPPTSKGDADGRYADSLDPTAIEALPRLVKTLERAGFLTDHLALPFGWREEREGEAVLGTNPQPPSPLPANGNHSLSHSPSSPVKRRAYSESSSDLSYSHSSSDSESVSTSLQMRKWRRSSYMGVCKLPHTAGAVHRRIDIKVYPRELAAFAILYFTGSDHFNRSMRLYATKKGFHLSDKGLFRATRDSNNVAVKVGKMVPCSTEREIFEHLGLPFKEPCERNSADVIAKDLAANTVQPTTCLS